MLMAGASGACKATKEGVSRPSSARTLGFVIEEAKQQARSNHHLKAAKACAAIVGVNGDGMAI